MPEPPPGLGSASGTPETPGDASARIDRFSYYVVRRLNLAGLFVVALGLCTADFVATGNAFWTGLLTGAQAVLAIPWAWTVVRMDHAEARILDSKRLGRFRRVAGHAVTFALVGVVLLVKGLVVRRALADGGFGHLVGPYRTYVAFVFVLFAMGLLGRGSRLARFLGSIADHPARIMAISFGSIALFGAFLLSLPPALSNLKDANFVDALFTSTSAVCVTRLAVNDISVTYSPFGQAVIFLLIQTGGLGIMVLTASIAILTGRRLRARSTAALTEMIDAESFSAMRRAIRHIFVFTMAIELAGAVALYLSFASYPEVALGPEDPHPVAGAGSRVWSAVFHSVSAFCNAGFSLSHGNLAGFVGSVRICTIVGALITLGGLGFPVLDELWDRLRWRKQTPRARLSLHTRVVLVTSAVLVVAGTLLFLVLEWHGTLRDLPVHDKFLAALFQSVVTRTAGFNTISIAALSAPVLLGTCFLMFIGGSPGSTAGGVKTTSVAVLLASFRAELTNVLSTPRLFDRSVPDSVARRAVAVAVGGMVFVAGGWFVLLLTEPGLRPLNLFFEVVSAFATCGLSAGTTPDLTPLGRLVVSGLMFVGRIGPVTVALAMIARGRREAVRVPEERVLIG